MFDINFYMKVHDLKYRVMGGEKFSREFLIEKLEEFRSPEPVVYNIETTNACNMRCEMCPRTTMMTRLIETLDKDTFGKIIEQLRPWTEDEWSNWESFVQKNFSIMPDDMAENHFFLYIIPKVIVLHGYGDPLLDKNIPDYVAEMTKRGLQSYFSCNPANINMKRTIETFKNGLDYIKYSVESVDDLRHKEVRGEKSNFTQSYRDIVELLNVKEQQNLDTTIVITMINLNKPWQQEEFEKLKDAFHDLDAYVYLKSQDQMWYEDNQQTTQSLHWTEFCQFPWSSMTIKSNGEAVQCVEDFNNQIILGNAKEKTLSEIWNNEEYKSFRMDHFNLTPGIKCTEECDMKLIGEFLTI